MFIIIRAKALKDKKTAKVVNMGVDKETKPSYINFWIDDNPKMIEDMRVAYTEAMGDEEPKKLILCDGDGFSITPEELYLDNDSEGVDIYCSFEMKSPSGSVSGTISIPLSDTLLIDILQHSIKKLNKLKVAMESLK